MRWVPAHTLLGKDFANGWTCVIGFADHLRSVFIVDRSPHVQAYHDLTPDGYTRVKRDPRFLFDSTPQRFGHQAARKSLREILIWALGPITDGHELRLSPRATERIAIRRLLEEEYPEPRRGRIDRLERDERFHRDGDCPGGDEHAYMATPWPDPLSRECAIWHINLRDCAVVPPAPMIVSGRGIGDKR